MYALNVMHLKQFYQSPLGQVVSRVLAGKLDSLWGNAREDVTVVIGFAYPLWAPDALPENLAVTMPATLGAMVWPGTPPIANRVAAVHEQELPIADSSVNRVILLHSLEHSADVSTVMQEVARILTPQGRLLAMVPNRLSLWARASQSPFGYGRPFSLTQIKSVIEESQLHFLRAQTVLFLPPSRARYMLKIATLWEVIGRFFVPMCGGIHIVEAEKQIQGAILQPVKMRRRPAFVPSIAPVAAGQKNSRRLGR